MEQTDQKESRKQLFTRLYKQAFPTVANFVSKHGGSFQDARDVFQEALIVYYERSATNDQDEYKIGYLIGIARHMWYKQFEQQKYSNRIDLEYGVDPVYVDDSYVSHEKLLVLLERTGNKCMELLKAFYYDKLSIRSLSNQFGFSSDRSATVQKYKCLEKIRNEVRNKKMTYEDFLE